MQKLVFSSLLALYWGAVLTVSPQVALSQAAHVTKPKLTSAQAQSEPATSVENIVPKNVAVILNSGSTKTIGYRLFVFPSGQVRYIDGDGRKIGKISVALTQQFFSDLRAAMPLEKLPTKKPCRKPIAVGTSTTIRLGAAQSPDVSCPGNAIAQALFHDVTAIAKALSVRNIPRTQGRELPPWNF